MLQIFAGVFFRGRHGTGDGGIDGFGRFVGHVRI
jgi:hypothetical protein